MKKNILAVAAIGAIAFAGLASVAPAQAIDCGVGAFYVNTGDALKTFSPEGTELTSVPLAASYGDMALSLDHSTVYGVFNEASGSSPDGDVVDVVNASTGAYISSFTLTGPAAGVGSWVGAAILPSGELVIGTGDSGNVYKVNVSTGASTLWVNLADADASITGNMGDFARLPDGDEIAIGDTGGSDATLVRIHEDGTMAVAGHIPASWGAGRVGENLMVTGSEMYSIKIADIPASGSGTITSTQLNSFSDAWGAAGTQDGETGTCDPALPDTGINSGTALTVGLIAAGLGLAGAASIVMSRRKRA
jgi:hypothetical protein